MYRFGSDSLLFLQPASSKLLMLFGRYDDGDDNGDNDNDVVVVGDHRLALL